MAAKAETGMDRQEMKKLLVRSGKQPVNCAVGYGPDPKVALLLMDRIKNPKAVLKQLEADVPGAKNLRFGTVSVDPEADPKRVVLTLNKPLPSIARKLVKTLKGTGFTKVAVAHEDGSAGEDAEEEDQPGTEAAPEPVAANAAPPAAAASQAPNGAAGPAAAPSEKPAPPAASVATVRKVQDAWKGMHRKLRGDIDGVRGAVLDAYRGHPVAPELEKAFDAKIGPLLDRLDGALSDKLEALASAPDAATAKKLAQEAQKIVQGCQAHVAGDPFVAALDANPVKPAVLRKTLDATFAVLQKSIAASAASVR